VDIRKVVVTLALVPVAAFLVWDRVNARTENRNAELRDTVLSYLAQPQFSGSDFLKRLTGINGNVEMYDLVEGMVYLSIPKNEFRGQETIKKLARDPETVQFAEDRSGVQKLGEYRLYEPDQKFFRMPSREFRVDGGSVIETVYGKGIIPYRVTVAELADYLAWRVTYNGPEYFRYRNAGGIPYRISNHGAFVAKRGEPSLERFIRPITTRTKSTDMAVGALLYFVTNYIAYDPLEVMDDAQVMKRPSEVLLTEKATCSGKTILFASLLEQLGADYLLAYAPGGIGRRGHIAVLVAGDFPNYNGYAMTVFGKKYQYAETTARDFLIGRATLTRDLTKEIRFVQRPGGPVLDRVSGKPLEPVD
jgi:hypothetical protein